MTLTEAHQILNTNQSSDQESISNKYEHLFNVNERTKGGSFYIQSKVFTHYQQYN